MAKIEQELAPFQTPNFVRLKPSGSGRGSENTPCIPLRAVPEEVLLQMCEDFKAEVLRKRKQKVEPMDHRDLVKSMIGYHDGLIDK